MKENDNKVFSENLEKNYKTHLKVFIALITILVILSWLLPVILNIRENLIEKYLMLGFAAFLIFFLFWLKK